MKTSDEILAEILLQQAHLDYINAKIEDALDNDDEDTLSWLYSEQNASKNELKALRAQYKNSYKRHTGKITIEYEDINDDDLWQIRRWLNSFVYTAEQGTISYHTDENTTVLYSKDFPNLQNDKQ